MNIISIKKLRDINLVSVEIDGCQKQFNVDKSCETDSEIIQYIEEWYSSYL